MRDAREIPEVSVTDYIFEKLRKNLPDLKNRDYLVDIATGVSIKFRDLENHSLRIASGLSRLGFKKGDILYYVTYETALLYVVQLAVWRLGGSVRGNYQQDNVSEYTRQLNETRSRFILIDVYTISLIRKAISGIEWSVNLINVGPTEVTGVTSVTQLLKDDGTACPETIDVDVHEDIILIPNTSGSTGKPKGVLHTHFTVVAMMHSNLNFAVSNEALMTPMSNYAIGSFMINLNSICKGVTIYHLGSFQKLQYIDFLIKFKPTTALMYPFIATWFARSPLLDTLDLSFVKKIAVGGSVLDPTTARLLEKRLPNAKVTQLYGMSESMFITSTELESTNNRLVITENEGEMCVSSGKLITYVQAKVLDKVTGKNLGPGKRGHIFVRSPFIMKGYLVAAGHQPNRSCIDKDGWLQTGDIGFFDADGNIFVKERTSFIFKYYMHFVSPSEIESVLQEHAAVQAAGVVGIPHPETTSLARAFVVLRDGCCATSQQLEQHVAARLPTYMHLHGGVRFVNVLPESKGGKLDRMALIKLVNQENIT